MAKNVKSNNQYVIFVAVNDGEAAEIKKVCEATQTEYVAKRIGWGAKADDFREEIDAALEVGKTPVLVELAGAEVDGAVVIDHHGDYVDRPAALLQVLDLLNMEPTRWQSLVAANDAAYYAGMEALGATNAEMAEVRAYDRRYQLVEQPYGSGNWVEKFSPEVEKAAEEAIAAMKVINGLQIVRFAYDACAAITDRLWLSNAPQKLLILCANGESDFFGSWELCEALRGEATGEKTQEGYDIFSHFGGWTGGKAIQAGYECGFWGGYADQQAVEAFVLDWFGRVQFINCTPHAIKLNDGTTFEPSGSIARVSQTTSFFSGHGIATQSFGAVTGLPAPQPNTIYIVSAMVLGRAQAEGRTDVVAPATGHPLCVRDAEKRIVSVPGFLR